VGKAGKLKGSKINLLVDKNGLPVNVSVTAAGRDDRYAGFTLYHKTLKSSVTKAMMHHGIARKREN
jgi:hypothetical protein